MLGSQSNLGRGLQRSMSAGVLPASLAELPFLERPLFELLGFDLGREALQLDYTGFGWAQPTRLHLESTSSGHVQVVESPLVLALHSSDHGPALPNDILLELVLSEPQGGQADDTTAAVATPLSRFLSAWLPRLPGEGPVVLALCNPHRAALPALAGARPLWYASGDVDSWLDSPASPASLVGPQEQRAGGQFRLSAEAWRLAG